MALSFRDTPKAWTRNPYPAALGVMDSGLARYARARNDGEIVHAPLASAPAAGARLEERCPRQDSRRRRPALRDPPGADRRARGGNGVRRDASRRRGRRAGARQGDAVAATMFGSAGPRRRPDAGARSRHASASRRIGPMAAEQLRALRGRTHELHSAVALVRDGRGVVFLRGDRAADDARFLRPVS